MARKRKPRKNSKPVRQLLPAPDTTQVSRLADWLELSAWAQSDKKISRSEVTSAFNFQGNNESADDMVNSILSEIKDRASSLQAHYPFELIKNEEVFSLKEGNTNSSYIFCLLISYVGLANGTNKLKLWKTPEVSRLFEELCACVAHQYVSDSLGSATDVLHFGSPRKLWDKAKRHIKPALEELVKVIGDGESIVSSTRDTRRIRGDGGDGGLDIMAIRRFSDGRPGTFMFLGQCATAQEKSEYMDKVSDLTNFLTDTARFESPLLMAFFIPHILSHIDSDHQHSWERIKKRENIPFDRLRIAYYGNIWKPKKINNFFLSCQKKIKKEYSLV